MKLCPRCGEAKPHSAYAKNAARKDGLQSLCRSCHKVYKDRHYADNRKAYVQRSAAQTARVRGEVAALKHGPCADCGKAYPPYVMDFDHVRGEKRGDVAHLTGRVSRGSLQEEIEKCDLVCANCHRERTFRRRTAL